MEKYEKDLLRLKVYAETKGYHTLSKAIVVATELHKKQYRKSGEPYISHPVKVTLRLIALGVDDEKTLTASILHDVVEDCNVTPSQLVYDHKIDSEIVDIVVLVSKNDMIPNDLYYDNISKDVSSALIKIADRWHNISTMVRGFTVAKISAYIIETNTEVMQLCRRAKERYPEYANAIYVMRDSIEDLVEVATAFVLQCEKTSGENTCTKETIKSVDEF